jgi:branched-chain amino acid transport system substrate-binding protein
MRRRRLLESLRALVLGLTASAGASDVPAEFKLGTLYASSGRFANNSMSVRLGLKLWLEQKNAEGSVFVKAFN